MPDQGKTIVMPLALQQHYQGCSAKCDMLVGPCECGAWHRLGEWYNRSERVGEFIDAALGHAVELLNEFGDGQ